MCVEKPSDDLHSVYRPFVCFVLQGAKRAVVGSDEHILREGQSAVFAAGMLVVGQILEASQEEPFLSVELELALLRELAAQIGGKPASRSMGLQALFAEDDADGQALDCAWRLLQLLDRPEAAAILRPGIMCELHYWLLSGRHGETLRTLGDPASCASRLAPAIAMLREQYRSRITIEQLAAAASMSLTAFHKHFKTMTSLTPGQYRKRLRLSKRDVSCSTRAAP